MLPREMLWERRGQQMELCCKPEGLAPGFIIAAAFSFATELKTKRRKMGAITVSHFTLAISEPAVDQDFY